MQIVKASVGSSPPSEQRTATFTGQVYADPVLASPGEVTVARVFFAPAARTFWHWHERGQLLYVVSGRGLICADGGLPEELAAGDIVWAPPGERHWHGGGPNTVLLHLATSLGKTNWLDAVSDAEYAAGD
jgi:quercetin dioxygenase-like cupin family protein